MKDDDVYLIWMMMTTMKAQVQVSNYLFGFINAPQRAPLLDWPSISCLQNFWATAKKKRKKMEKASESISFLCDVYFCSYISVIYNVKHRNNL